MAVEKITFADKVSMIISSLPIINRIRDVDINEIKSVVNNNADELTAIKTINDFSSNVTFSETSPVDKDFWEKDGIVSIAYRGSAITHASNQTIFTIPSAYRPSKEVVAPFTKGGTAYGILAINPTTGVCSVVFCSSNSSTDRLVTNFSYIL